MKPVALILLAYATGTTPETLNPFIKDFVDKGIPVFLLPKNFAGESGIQRVTYEPQVRAIEAGATPLRDVNIKSTLQVVEAIQTAAKQGLAGKGLNDAIATRFGTVGEVSTK